MRDSIIFYRSFYEAINELPQNMQAKVYAAIFEYSLNFNEVVLNGLPKTIFTLIKPQLDANNKRFENGSKGGRKKTETEPKKNQAETETEANNNDNVNENNNANDNILLEKETKDILSDEGSETDLVNPEIQEAKKVAQKKVAFKPPSLQEVQEYCNERQNGIQAFTFVNFYQSKGWLIGKNPMKDWKAAIHTWESKNKEQNGNSNTGQSNSNGNGYSSGNNQFGKGGKITASQMVARARQEAAAGYSESGNRTSDAEILT